jgi:hypothetical protein
MQLCRPVLMELPVNLEGRRHSCSFPCACKKLLEDKYFFHKYLDIEKL